MSRWSSFTVELFAKKERFPKLATRSAQTHTYHTPPPLVSAAIVHLLRYIHQGLAVRHPLLGSCLLCGTSPPPGATLCRECIADLPTASGICLRCGRWDGTAQAPRNSCNECSNRPRDIERVMAPYVLHPPLDTLIWRMKFGPDLLTASALGDLLAHYLANSVCKYSHTVLPIPLHRTRLLDRGFNQAAELSTRLARHLGLPNILNGLRRVRSTAPQTTVNTLQARRANLRGAFRSNLTTSPSRRILLVDDVMTTGATLSAAAHCLRQIDGVERVDVAVVARAPRTSREPFE